MEALQETQLHKSEMIDSNEKLLNSADSHDVGSLLDFTMSFQQFGDLYLDKRLTSSLTDTLKYDYPTLVQSKAIPILLQRKDALIQARTGSGKTLAYAVPMIQHCLTTFPNNIPKPFFGCVLVPTRELATQVRNLFNTNLNDK
jgi:ATP-dependent RNA helicase DDX56/DBP9